MNPEDESTDDEQPAWIPCPDCEGFLCQIHGGHAADCPCPPIEEWQADPYRSGHYPQPAHRTETDLERLVSYFDELLEISRSRVSMLQALESRTQSVEARIGTLVRRIAEVREEAYEPNAEDMADRSRPESGDPEAAR